MSADASLVEKLDKLDPKAREEVMRRYRARREREVFYCASPGRLCDGEPHEGYPYPHARGNQWPPEGSDWLVWALIAGRGGGKALDVDTPILTAEGWSTMGALRTGDIVYDETGAPTTVLAAHDPYVAESLYRVHFSDGSALDADGEHLWVTWDHLDRKRWNRRGGYEFPPDWAARPAVTTADLARTQSFGSRGDREHCIPLAGPIQSPDVDLLIDPYVLGAWLGDGSSGGAEFTVADSDFAEMAERLGASGSPLSGGRRKSGSACATYGIGVVGLTRDAASGRMVANDSLRSRLRAMNQLRNKHIPEAYLLAGQRQRIELLRGLMDTDGYVDPSKSCVEFSSTSRALAEGVLALARSLSERPVLSEGRATLSGVDCGPKYRVCWRPSLFTPFSLQRKASGVRPAGRQALRLRHRMITRVERIDTTVVRCITVDSPNAMYLAGSSLIPTHNTRTGSEYTAEVSGRTEWLSIIGPTNSSVRDVMVEGPSGIIKTCERLGKPCEYKPALRRIIFQSGAKATLFSAEEPDRLRGPNHGFVWGDEPSHWANLDEVWAMVKLGLRMGGRPHALLTTTPLPNKWTKDIIANPRTRVVRFSTYENIHNLAPTFREEILTEFEGTYLGRQEIHGEVIDDRQGALWSSEQFQYVDISTRTLERIVIGVDPAGSSGKRSDETGIIVCGILDGSIYVLDDFTGKFTPQGWAAQTRKAYDKWNADAVVVERNYGGDMVRDTLVSSGFDGRILEARATDGKRLRAEPVAARYERGEAFHARGGNLSELESEMVSWVPGEGKSPNRVDALVWAATELRRAGGGVASLARAGGSIRPSTNRGPGTKRSMRHALNIRKR